MQSGTSNPADRVSSTQEQASPAKNPKRQRQSSHTPDSHRGDPSDTSSVARGRRDLILPPIAATVQRGSSRSSTGRDTMRSSTPPDVSSGGSIKYTRTGRVSKATKGQRVHHCEECGKTYTRAEHLRRHQQNHKPGAYPCDFPGCDRSFHREDLLTRHKQRHNDLLNPPSRRPSIGSQGPAHEPGLPPNSLNIPHPAAPVPGTRVPTLPPQDSRSDMSQSHPGGPSRTPKRPIPPNELSIAVEYDDILRFTNPFNPSSPISTCDYESLDDWTSLPYYPPGPRRSRYPSEISYLGSLNSTSRSPESTGSSTIYLPHRSYQSGGERPYQDAHYECGNGFPYMNQPSNFAFPPGVSRSLTGIAEMRDFMEQNELILPGAVGESVLNDNWDATETPTRQRYLDAYWDWVHEFWPVVHQPTFNYDVANPLLRAAMLALGGQTSNDRSDLFDARVMHEKCHKVLKKRAMHRTHTYRICDMQAILLIEVYSIFKSRRPPLQLSKDFEDIYQRLSNDTGALMPTPTASPVRHGSFVGEMTEGDFFKINTYCKQRLLLACYTLEQQHIMLFGRKPVAWSAGICSNLPMPSSQAEWDAALRLDTEVIEPPQFERVSDTLKAPSYLEAGQEPHDAFRSTVLLACLCDSNSDFLEWGSTYDDFPILFACEESPRTKLAYHIFMLCGNTPMRELLAVAGESWVMAEKIGTKAEYTDAQNKIRQWASKTFTIDSSGQFGFAAPKQSAQRALSHALSILGIHRTNPKTGLLFQEWAVYLASIVVWALAYSLPDFNRQQRLSMPSPMRSGLSPAQLDHSMATLVSAGANALRGWTDAQNTLSWAKAKIERIEAPQVCGLTSGALDVLNKLVKRGNEEGWF